MISNLVTFMEEMNEYYIVWWKFHFVYEEWAAKQGISVNSLFLLISIYEDTDACTQKKISQRWQMPKQTVHAIWKCL